MRGRKAPREWCVQVNGKIVGLLLLFGLCAAAQPVAAQLVSGPGFEFETIPSYPTPSDDITIKLFGYWGRTGVPMDSQLEIMGSNIRIATSNSFFGCGPLETGWMLMVPIGQLPAGMYHVTVTYSSPSFQSPPPPITPPLPLLSPLPQE